MIAGDMLEDEQHTVLTAQNGAEAVAIYQQRQPELDIILMDCLMPEMDGFEATKAIRSYEQTHHLRAIPIIALTANAYRESRDQCFEAGMTAFISKPIDGDTLYETIETQMQKFSVG